MKIGYLGYLWRYVFYAIVVNLAFFAFFWAFETFAPTWAEWFYGTGGLTGLNVAAIMLPGIYLGQKFFRSEGRTMTRKEGWSLAILCTCIASVIIVGLLMWMQANDPWFALELQKAQDMPGFVPTMLAVGFLILLVITRLAMWSAGRGEARRAARTAPKD